jgi:two-component system, cell cycle response regulator
MPNHLQEDSPLIIVADDEEFNRRVLTRRLEQDGFRVVTANDGREAILKVKELLPDLVILDLMMPIMDGLEACRHLKEDIATADIPVIFLSARDDPEAKVTGLTSGANDYINKPFKAEELTARVNVALRLKREHDNLRMSAEEAHQRAEVAQEQSMVDGLTGLYNRHGMQRALLSEYSMAQRHHRALSCLMIDLDHFKSINDRYGHIIGDATLKQLASILLQNLRRSDVICRYGGEEFLILLPETDIKGASIIAEKIHAVIASQLFGEGETRFPVTLSIGISQFREEESGDEMIARADAALYQAKKMGRNRTECDFTLI